MSITTCRPGRRRNAGREYLRLLEDIKAGLVDAVIVYVLDRLHRQPRELEEFFEVCDAAGITALASVTGDVDLANADGRFMARILGAVARKESDDKSRRIKRKHEELAKAGKVSGGGTRPYGYEADRMTIRKDEAAVIREAAETGAGRRRGSARSCGTSTPATSNPPKRILGILGRCNGC